MGCKLNIDYKGNINELFELGRREASAIGGFVNGNLQSGVFSINALRGTFSGNYSVNANMIEINLDKKPFLIPCVVIEKFLKSNIS